MALSFGKVQATQFILVVILITIGGLFFSYEMSKNSLSGSKLSQSDIEELTLTELNTASETTGSLTKAKSEVIKETEKNELPLIEITSLRALVRGEIAVPIDPAAIWDSDENADGDYDD